MNYVFTKNGERKVEHFIQSCVEKRKRMVEEGIDTDDLIDNARNLSAKDILLSINYFHVSDLKKHTYSVLITDHFRGELTLIYELISSNVENSQLSMTRSIKNILQKISLMFLKIF